MASITTNVSAKVAQQYLNKADKDLQASVAKLSSGSRINKPSVDASGMSIGTVLKVNLATQEAALTNTEQAKALLGVSDGAYGNIADILQRQKSLATQATSGSLNAQTRSFINEEFQNLTSEIDRIASNTNFNNIKLVDGSLYSPSSLKTATSSQGTSAKGTMKIAAALSGGESVFINGAEMKFLSDANRSALAGDQQVAAIDITNNTTAATQAAALYNAIQNTLHYSGTDATVIGLREKLNQFTYAYTAASDTITITATAQGAYTNGVASGTNYCVGSNTATATNFLVNGGDAGGLTSTTGIGIGIQDATHSPSVVAVSGNLDVGVFPTTGTAYATAAVGGTNYYPSAIAQGAVGDSILNALAVTAQATTGVDVSKVSNNPDFTGKISGIKATYVADNIVSMEVKIGSYTYIAENVNTAFAANTKVTFKAVPPGNGINTTNGGSFNLTFAANTISVRGQSDADTVANRVNSALSTVEIFQRRTVSSYVAAGTIYGTPGQAATGNLAGSSIQFINSNFKNMEVSDIKVTAPVLGASAPTITMTVNGEVYQSGYDATGAVSALTTSLATGSYGLVSTSNPKNMIIFNYSNATNLDLSTQVNANAAQASLVNAFGINKGASQISFQVGTNVNDNIGVQLKSAKSKDLFVSSSGVTESLDIGTADGAIKANNVLDEAINKIVAIRASLGALESRFNYASANLQSAIQNQDVARGVFLDTEVSKEASDFAKYQVQLQASISVLSAANGLPEQLLKLIG